jgi:uncharacterized PurR-regulated membrane protein YhhQ (DUF165 family)
VHRLLAPLGIALTLLVVLANWLAARYVVDVPFTPYAAPAGVFCIGAVLVIRDWMQQSVGLARTMAAVYVAGVLSFAVGELAGWTPLQRVALGSIVAFTISETLEAVVFTPIRSRSLGSAVALSATVGNAIDSLVFLSIAFGSTAFFWGQFWGKTEAIAVGVALTLARRRLVLVGLTDS